jgi:hypothetical protein
VEGSRAGGPSPTPVGVVVWFVLFHEWGSSVPAGRFIRVVLQEYSLELQNLNPNDVQQMAAFEALCEGYLEKGAHWDLSFTSSSWSEMATPRRPSGAPGCAEARGDGGVHPDQPAYFQQRMAQGVVLSQERP